MRNNILAASLSSAISAGMVKKNRKYMCKICQILMFNKKANQFFLAVIPQLATRGCYFR